MVTSLHPEFTWNLKLCSLSALCRGTGTVSQTVETSKGDMHMIVDCDIIINTTHGTRKEDLTFRNQGGFLKDVLAEPALQEEELTRPWSDIEMS